MSIDVWAFSRGKDVSFRGSDPHTGDVYCHQLWKLMSKQKRVDGGSCLKDEYWSLTKLWGFLSAWKVLDDVVDDVYPSHTMRESLLKTGHSTIGRSLFAFSLGQSSLDKTKARWVNLE